MIARRRFLQTVGGGALAGAGLSLVPPLAAQTESASGNAKMPRLLAGCCAYSYREMLSSGAMTLEDFIRRAVELRLDGVDMTVYYLKSTDPAYLEGLRHLAYKNAVMFSGVACGSSMVQATAEKRAAALTDIKNWIDVTDRLGASHLRVFAGKLPQGATLGEATGWVVEALKAASDYAAPKGIMLGLEDHVGVSQSAEVCLDIMQRVSSPYVGINLDITHFIATPAADRYAQIAACIPYATVSHIRPLFDDGTPIDLDRVFGMYAAAGHKGFMSLEYEPPKGGESAATGVPKMVARIRALCQKYSSV